MHVSPHEVNTPPNHALVSKAIMQATRSSRNTVQAQMATHVDLGCKIMSNGDREFASRETHGPACRYDEYLSPSSCQDLRRSVRVKRSDELVRSGIAGIPPTG